MAAVARRQVSSRAQCLDEGELQTDSERGRQLPPLRCPYRVNTPKYLRNDSAPDLPGALTRATFRRRVRGQAIKSLLLALLAPCAPTARCRVR